MKSLRVQSKQPYVGQTKPASKLRLTKGYPKTCPKCLGYLTDVHLKPGIHSINEVLKYIKHRRNTE